MLEDFRYERNLASLISELSNVNFFIANSTLTEISLNPEFEDLFNKCSEKIQQSDLNQLSDLQLNRVVESAPANCKSPHFWNLILDIT
jgi:hypothetical protein